MWPLYHVHQCLVWSLRSYFKTTSFFTAIVFANLTLDEIFQAKWLSWLAKGDCMFGQKSIRIFYFLASRGILRPVKIRPYLSHKKIWCRIFCVHKLLCFVRIFSFKFNFYLCLVWPSLKKHNISRIKNFLEFCFQTSM